MSFFFLNTDVKMPLFKLSGILSSSVKYLVDAGNYNSLVDDTTDFCCQFSICKFKVFCLYSIFFRSVPIIAFSDSLFYFCFCCWWDFQKIMTIYTSTYIDQHYIKLWYETILFSSEYTENGKSAVSLCKVKRKCYSYIFKRS